MTIGRQLPGRDYKALKAATRRLVEASGGPSAAAEVTRGAHQHLSAYGSANDDQADRFMPVDVLADLECQVGQPLLTRALARLSGFLLVPAPKPDVTGSALGIITASALKEISEVFVALADGMGDGKISTDDADKIGKEIDEALAKLVALKLQVNLEAGADL